MIAYLLVAVLLPVLGLGVWAFLRLTQPALRAAVAVSTIVGAAGLVGLIIRI